MEGGNCAGECHDISLKLMEKSSDDVCVEQVIDPAMAKTSKQSVKDEDEDNDASFGPITPDSTREIGDYPYNCDSPPTEVKKKIPLKIPNFDADADADAALTNHHSISPKTPEESVFDPFAPGPQDMMLAPICRKYIDQMRTSVARRLNFDCSVRNVDSGTQVTAAAESFSDEEMFECVYENLLEAIVSNQAEGFLAEFTNKGWDSDGCMTPHSAPFLNGVAETCPGAPIKPSAKSRNIDLGLCRKLEF